MGVLEAEIRLIRTLYVQYGERPPSKLAVAGSSPGGRLFEAAGDRRRESTADESRTSAV